MGGEADNGPGGRWEWDPLVDQIPDASRLAEVSAQGLRLASDLIERVLDSLPGPGEGAGEGERPDEPRPEGSGAGAAQVLLTAWTEVLRDVSSAVVQAADGAGGANGSNSSNGSKGSSVDLDLGGPPPSPDQLVRLRVDLDGVPVDGPNRLWLHNGDESAAGAFRLTAGELRTPDGSRLPARVAFDPAEVDLPALSSRGVTLSLEVDGPLSPGSSRTIVQVGGAPDIWLPIEVVVVEAPPTDEA
jgi:hypothetical protein